MRYALVLSVLVLGLAFPYFPFRGGSATCGAGQPCTPASLVATGAISGTTLTATSNAADAISTVGGISAGMAITLSTGDSSGTPGNATINKPRGRSAMDVGASTFTITNSQVAGTASQVQITISNSAGPTGCTLFRVSAIATGQFTVSANANCTGSPVVIDWVVLN